MTDLIRKGRKSVQMLLVLLILEDLTSNFSAFSSCFLNNFSVKEVWTPKKIGHGQRQTCPTGFQETKMLLSNVSET